MSSHLRERASIFTSSVKVRETRAMPRTPNYDFERRERDRLKAQKKAEKLAEKQAAKEARKQGEASGEGGSASESTGEDRA